MKKNCAKLLLVSALLLVLLTSCALPPGGKEVQLPLVPVNCIAVLPAGTIAAEDNSMNYARAKNLESGAAFVNSLLARELADHAKVRMLSESQVLSLVPEMSGGMSGMVSHIGQKLNCDAVLSTTVRQFEQREGTDYAVDTPASAEIVMVLRHAVRGTVLWSTDFQETQQSFFDNILSFDKMQQRGFKWVTVEQLVEEGLVEKLGQCPYLH